MQKYKPSYKPQYIPEASFSRDYSRLEETLLPYANTGILESYDGLKLHYEYYLAENAKASVVIVHGFTEFIRKYRELCAFLLDMGLNVFVYDQRGHGLSGREAEDLTLAHVSSFDAYVQDLEQVIQKLVLPVASVPLYLFSHSMGGATAALYLQKYPERIEKAIFSAPMICPQMRGAPRRLMQLVLRREIRKKGKESPFFGATSFNAHPVLELSSDQSKGRFQMNMETRLSDVRYQGARITNGWLLEATRIKDRLLTKATGRIQTKILIFSAEHDGVVINRDQKVFLQRLKSARLITVKEAKHNILNGSPFILREVYDSIKEFFTN